MFILKCVNRFFLLLTDIVVELQKLITIQKKKKKKKRVDSCCKQKCLQLGVNVFWALFW